MLSQPSRTETWVVQEEDNVIKEVCTVSQIHERLYSMKDMKKARIEEKLKEKMKEED